jgi:putative protease
MALKKKKTKKKPAVKRKPVKRSAKRRVPIKKAKKTAKKGAKKGITKKKAPAKVEGKLIGAITHYFPHVQAGVIKLKDTLTVGDTIRVKGHTTDFKQEITSMQIDHVPVNEAKKGAEIGLLVNSRVRQHDAVYKI